MKGPPGVIRGYTVSVPSTHQQGALAVSGFTTDAAGVVITGVTVLLFDDVSDTVYATTTSDANGAFSFTVSSGTQVFFLSGFKAGTGSVIINLFGRTDTMVATAA